MESLDCVVIGAGVVGLATARRLALAGRKVALLEAEASTGVHTSSRNSDVIHAGIYHPPGWLKSRLCVAGSRALYAYLVDRGVPHRRIGKLLIAVKDEEIATLERCRQQAEANGVRDLTTLSREDLRALEPAIVAVRGTFSPSTGIVDTSALMAALQVDLEAAGGWVALSSPVVGGQIEDGGIVLDIGGVAPYRVRCKTVINSAGFRAPSVAYRIHGLDPRFIPGEHYAKGHYFALTTRSPFRHLVYPMPAPGAGSIHVTLELSGRTRFGPDTTWSPNADYVFDTGRAQLFYDAVRRYYPDLADGTLVPGRVGIRSKIVAEGEPRVDFQIQGPRVHGIAGLVNLFGIESPGLTACLAIGDEVLERLG